MVTTIEGEEEERPRTTIHKTSLEAFLERSRSRLRLRILVDLRCRIGRFLWFGSRSVEQWTRELLNWFSQVPVTKQKQNRMRIQTKLLLCCHKHTSGSSCKQTSPKSEQTFPERKVKLDQNKIHFISREPSKTIFTSLEHRGKISIFIRRRRRRFFI